MRPGTSFDGRWLAAALLVVYFIVLVFAGPAAELTARWRRAGVFAYPAVFVDLQVFPAARATVAGGGALYGASVADPMQRPYNYPRVWLAFMRFPASENWLRLLGGLLAAGAVAAVLAFWGRLSVGEGLLGGLLLCSPAIQLGIERGNTDLAMLVLVTGGVLLAGDGKHGRLGGALWFTAATLKLFPILAFGAWFEGTWRDWLRRTWLPLGLFAAYLVLIRKDLPLILHNTGGGWVQSYGSEVLAAAWAQARVFYGLNWAGDLPLAGAGRLLATAGVGWILLRSLWSGRDRRGPDQGIPGSGLRSLLGFRVGALVYIGTFLAGSSFDYRQGFLLLTLPQLFFWRRKGEQLPAVALAALLVALGTNYLLAGWPGFILNETASWLLFFVLAALLAGTWGRPFPTRTNGILNSGTNCNP